MAKAKLMIVEDEGLVALSIQSALENFGYEVIATTGLASKVMQLAVEHAPDLILMDIRLKGDVDGIEVANSLRNTLKIPVVYLTAHSDEKTLERAKQSEPFGYIVKPYEDRTLYATVEIALFTAQLRNELVRTKERLATILSSLQETVITMDLKGRIEYFNAAAEKLTGLAASEAIGEGFFRLLMFRNRADTEYVSLPVSRIIMGGEGEIRLRLSLVASGAAAIPVDITLAGVRSEAGAVVGIVVTIRKDAE